MKASYAASDRHSTLDGTRAAFLFLARRFEPSYAAGPPKLALCASCKARRNRSRPLKKNALKALEARNANEVMKKRAGCASAPSYAPYTMNLELGYAQRLTLRT